MPTDDLKSTRHARMFELIRQKDQARAVSNRETDTKASAPQQEAQDAWLSQALQSLQRRA